MNRDVCKSRHDFLHLTRMYSRLLPSVTGSTSAQSIWMLKGDSGRSISLDRHEGVPSSYTLSLLVLSLL